MAYRFEKSGKLKESAAEELTAADANSSVIVLDDGVLDDGTPYWLYIAVKPSKYREFMRLIRERQPMLFKDYGVIVRYGFEKEAPPAVKEEMKRLHGCDDHFMTIVAKEVKEAQTVFLK